MNWRGGIIVTLLLAIVGVCLFGYPLHQQSGIFREFEAVLLWVQWMLLVCLAVWCASFIFLTFKLNDLPLIGLLLIAVSMYFIGEAASWRVADAIILLAGVTLGRGAHFFLKIGNRKSEIGNFLIGLVVLLAFSSCWHLNKAGAYHGPRWMGLWDNPNDYGMLMGAGGTLAIGLFAARKAEIFFLIIAAGMMAVGLFFSYSRGAWVGTAIGLLYLAWCYGKLKWRFVLPAIVFATMVVWFFWNATPDNAPWYVKRMDFGRPSAQHRVAAWKVGFEIIRDHPFGVGWNKAVETYEKNYSPPDNGADAITTNSYLILGTELGLPSLLCFITYIYFKFKLKPADSLQVACRTGALALLVAFWFDGGLFDLPTASVFWILLELGTSDLAVNSKCLKAQCFPIQPA